MKKFELDFLKEEALSAGIKFDLDKEDLEDIPKFCEVLGIEINSKSENKDNWPFLLPIDRSLGWTKGNIKFISNKAGHILFDVTIEEIEKVLHYMKKVENRGSNNVHSKLTESDVRKIRNLSNSGLSQRKLAKKFGVSDSTIGRIIRREKWKHV